MIDPLLRRAQNQVRALCLHNALQTFHSAEDSGADPDLCAAGRWDCYMLLGDFESAWRESDLISSRGQPDPNRFWRGCSLVGKRVLIRCLHGLGDTIQFIRYVPLLREVAASVTIEAQPHLKRLLAQSGLADDVITWSEPEPPWEEQVEVMELPRIFRTTIDTIPDRVPYLTAKPRDSVALNANTLSVGLIWRSSAFNPARSIPMEELADVLDLPSITFYALQTEPQEQELPRCLPNIRKLHQHVSRIHETASLLKKLDLLITVDTMAAHLAGGLAVPVWTLLPYQCDWRWMLDRGDSPWYPTMRLFRQKEPGDWTHVVSEVKLRLAAFPVVRKPQQDTSQTDDDITVRLREQ